MASFIFVHYTASIVALSALLHCALTRGWKVTNQSWVTARTHGLVVDGWLMVPRQRDAWMVDGSAAQRRQWPRVAVAGGTSVGRVALKSLCNNVEELLPGTCTAGGVTKKERKKYARCQACVKETGLLPW